MEYFYSETESVEIEIISFVVNLNAKLNILTNRQ